MRRGHSYRISRLLMPILLYIVVVDANFVVHNPCLEEGKH